MRVAAFLCWLLAGTGFAAPARLFIEPFMTRADSEKLREDLIAEVRKQDSVAIVQDEANADFVVGGGGEVWIKGYRSLNPRSGRRPSNGTAIYSGFLSVELRNTRGETLWSYLATPSVGAEDVSKDLSKRIARNLVAALAISESPARSEILAQPATILKGAGATFPYPVYKKWFTNYRRENPSIEITYDAVGSETGMRRLQANEVDFGASDHPEPDDKYLMFPSVVGAVVPIVNLPGVPNDVAFTPEALAGIFLGKIKKWNDPLLQQANRGVRLPDLDIVVVHRADGSGTSYAFTEYLSKTNPEWQAKAGASLAPNWPVGRAANGNDGVAKLVKELGGSIGYVEFIYALQNRLSFGKVRNRNGEFVGASLESIEAAMSMGPSLVDSPNAGAYPICSYTWIVVPQRLADENKRRAIAGFLKWMLGPGQRQAAALGYVALPKDIIEEEQTAILKIR